MNLESIRPHLLYQFKSDHELVSSIQELSDKFTKNRDQIGDYLKDPRLVSAYTAFYLLTNIPKLAEVFKRLPSEFLKDIRHSPFVDFGAGPGTFSIAMKEWLGEEKLDFFQIEISSLMKEQGREIFKAFYPNVNLVQHTKAVEIKDSFLLFGHSSNEIGCEETMSLIEVIRPKHILFIEPGTKDFFKQILVLRGKLKELGFSQFYPCPHEEECPLKGSDSDWCHQYIQVKHHPDIERISQMAKKDRRNMPLTIAGFSKNNYSKTQERIIRVFPETKFSFEWEVCHKEKNDRYQLLKRNLNKDQIKSLEALLSGDEIQTKLVKDLGEMKRVEIISSGKS
jgi:ribosomal protein RSM22 (predicted rRNA methylase)